MTGKADFIVIGAGIAGASVAAELAREHSVILLEAEEQPGYHSTGRSAAMWVPEYGPAVIRALTKASGRFFHNPPDGFADAPLLAPRGEMMVALADQQELVEEELASATPGAMRQVSPAEMTEEVPLLLQDRIAGGLIDDEAKDIDVDALFQGFLRAFKRRGGTLVCNARVESLKRSELWEVVTKAGVWLAPVIVNAAGAWGDKVAELAGLEPVGLIPKRRSAAMVPPPKGVDITSWPLTFGAGETFYFKPSGGQLIVSPADATPVEPHDAWAEDMTIAEGIALFQEVMNMEITRVTHTWAGLRTFAPDGDPVVGYDSRKDGFFWLVGQGGYGIQTSPALSRVAAAMLTHSTQPSDLAEFAINLDNMSPERLFLSGFKKI